MSRKIWVMVIALLVASSAYGGFVAGVFIQRYSIGRILRQFGLATYEFIPASSEAVVLQTRRFMPALSRDVYDTEKDSVYENKNHPIDLQKTALILIDTWDGHPNDGYLARVKTHMETKLNPLLALARQHGLRVIHSPHELPLVGGREISPECVPVVGEKVIPAGLMFNAGIELDDYLKAQGVTTLIYAGYAVNWCILIRPTGILRMRDLGYEIILVRDCTLAWETPESLEGEWAKKMGVNLVEMIWGESTTFQDLNVALSAVSE
jgi:nicotinamidase-related amidase